MRNHGRLMAVGACLALMASVAVAQEVTFGASVTVADETLKTTLNWNAPGASGCEASGHAAWTGAKPASGTEDLPDITLSGTYQLTQMCVFPGNPNVRVSWQKPTTNTDGTALTNLAGYRIHYGTSPDTLRTSVEVPGADTLAHTITGLSPGTWYFGVQSVNSVATVSKVSAPATKTVSASSQKSAGVSLTVNPVPAAPGGLTVE
jgi:hypothetical protein